MKLAQSNQSEPVAWWHETKADHGGVVDLNVSGHGRPLYFAPPQRPWQGLTEQESGAIMEELNAYGTRLYEFARAIEAKLKEKNAF